MITYISTPLSLKKLQWKSFSSIVSILLLLGQPMEADSMEALDEQEMGAVTGQEGVMISLEYYYNAVRTDDPSTTGQGLASCGGPSDLGNMNCRLSWQLANRGAAGVDGIYDVSTWTYTASDGSTHTMQGEWLVWKAGWASVAVTGLMLDAASLGDAVSSGVAYESWLGTYNSSTPSSSTGNMIPVYGSFVDNQGNCLMPAGYGTDPCTVEYMKAMPALRTHFPGTGGGYDNNAKASTGFNDARFGLEVSGLSAEYDTGGVPGWMLNNGGSFTSLKIADNNGYQAGIAFGGDFYLYGF